MRRCTAAIVAIVTAGALALSSSASAVPIVPAGVSSLPDYQGAPATAKPIASAPRPEQNPFMAANPNSNIHNDTWMTDTYRRPGPLGDSLVTNSGAMRSAVCGSLTFDSAGRIITVCPSIPFPPQARIIDPVTLEILGTYELPTAPSPPGTKEYQNFAGGGYFFLDERDRVWVATRTDHLYVLAINPDASGFTLKRDYDLTGVLDTTNERISSALPDFDGNIWFATRRNGKVGVLDAESGDVKILQLDEEIQNSFAVASEGVYIVSEKKMYRFKATKSGRPRVVWSKRYANSGVIKPGQADAGSGTTPTILKNDYVAITDNADPMNVVVYRRSKKLGKGEHRTICRVPVFEQGASATDNSLIGVGRSLVVENNYGYQDPFGPQTGALTEPGFSRIDIKKNGKGCTKVWTNDEVRSPTVVPKMSTETGLIYTYSKPADPTANEGYFWTAIDYRTGETAWMKYAGSGLLFNNNYAGMAIGPDGTAYLGVIGGLISLRDG